MCTDIVFCRKIRTNVEDSRCFSWAFDKTMLLVKSLHWNLGRNFDFVCLFVTSSILLLGHVMIYKPTPHVQNLSWRSKTSKLMRLLWEIDVLFPLLSFQTVITKIGGLIWPSQTWGAGGKWGRWQRNVCKSSCVAIWDRQGKLWANTQRKGCGKDFGKEFLIKMSSSQTLIWALRILKLVRTDLQIRFSIVVYFESDGA